jgi:ATP-dependent Clp protease protease subunit
VNDVFYYTVDANADEPIMLIDRHVGYDEVDGFGIMGDMFQRELLALDGMGKKRIQVWINSPGGVVTDGYNIYNAIVKTKTKVDTYCTGIAASISAVIFQAGRTRYMSDYGKLMFHNPFGGDNKSLDAIRDSLVKMICSRSGAAEDVVAKMMNKTTWMGANEALDGGYCDEIQDTGSMNKKRSIKTLEEAKALWQESNTVLNSLFNKENSFTMKKVCNRLNLNQDANEESIVAEIDKISNNLKVANDAINAKNEDIKKKQEELAKAQLDLTAAQAKVKDLEDAKAKADLEAKAKADLEKAAKVKEVADNAKKLITGFVEQGKIKNEAAEIEKWEKKAVEDFDTIKALLENLPVNHKATKITNVVSTGGTQSKLTSVVANKMVENLAKQTK